MAPIFENRISLVTGGSRGVGRAVCLDLARKGSDVALIYRNRTDLAEAVAGEIEALGRRAMPIGLDLAEADAVKEAVARVAGEWGEIDLLVPLRGRALRLVPCPRPRAGSLRALYRRRSDRRLQRRPGGAGPGCTPAARA